MTKRLQILLLTLGCLSLLGILTQMDLGLGNMFIVVVGAAALGGMAIAGLWRLGALTFTCLMALGGYVLLDTPLLEAMVVILPVGLLGATWIEARGLARMWITTLVCLALLWGLGHLGTPRPELLGVILAVCLFGGVGLVGHGLWTINAARKVPPITSILLGFGAFSAAGIFAFQVLSNDDADIPVMGEALGIPAEPAEKLRIFNLNVLHGHPGFAKQKERFETTARILGHFRADITVLQEVWSTNQHGNMVEQLDKNLFGNYAFARANGSRFHIGFEEGGAIISRWPILEAKRFLMKPRSPLWESRIALLTKLDIGGDVTLTLVGVHLSESRSADDQAEYLMELMRDHSPDIIAGDFNSEPDSKAIQAVLKQGFVEAIPTHAIHGKKHHDLPNELVMTPVIDHVFLSEAFHKRWKIEYVSWVITSKPVSGDAVHERMAASDHDAILVDLRRR